MRLPRRGIRPPGRDHGEPLDVDQPALAQLDEIRAPHDVVDFHLVVIARADEAANSRATQLFGCHVHPALDAIEHHLLEAGGSLSASPSSSCNRSTLIWSG